ncbi:hypothetical protein GOC31_28560 [Sinorhizobium meliloti]|nr:hypothetical protein [Sinorhizobium meliloti]MDX0252582.1 hypothetical protein [Sinorhizobium meliloti]
MGVKIAPPELVYEPNAPNMVKEVVIGIQRALAARGFNPGEINSEYGARTQAAAADFQETEGLVVDGAVGPKTAAALSISPEKVPVSDQAVPETPASDLANSRLTTPCCCSFSPKRCFRRRNKWPLILPTLAKLQMW